MTSLLSNKRLKLRTALRIVRALDFINSEHAGAGFQTEDFIFLGKSLVNHVSFLTGIRCGSLFLVRRELTLNVGTKNADSFEFTISLIFFSRLSFSSSKYDHVVHEFWLGIHKALRRLKRLQRLGAVNFLFSGCSKLNQSFFLSQAYWNHNSHL